MISRFNLAGIKRNRFPARRSQLRWARTAWLGLGCHFDLWRDLVLAPPRGQSREISYKSLIDSFDVYDDACDSCWPLSFSMSINVVDDRHSNRKWLEQGEHFRPFFAYEEIETWQNNVSDRVYINITCIPKIIYDVDVLEAIRFWRRKTTRRIFLNSILNVLHEIDLLVKSPS